MGWAIFTVRWFSGESYHPLGGASEQVSPEVPSAEERPGCSQFVGLGRKAPPTKEREPRDARELVRLRCESLGLPWRVEVEIAHVPYVILRSLVVAVTRVVSRLGVGRAGPPHPTQTAGSSSAGLGRPVFGASATACEPRSPQRHGYPKAMERRVCSRGLVVLAWGIRHLMGPRGHTLHE